MTIVLLNVYIEMGEYYTLEKNRPIWRFSHKFLSKYQVICVRNTKYLHRHVAVEILKYTRNIGIFKLFNKIWKL